MTDRPCGGKEKLIKSGIRRYVRMRTSDTMWKLRRRRKCDPVSDNAPSDTVEYHPTDIRYIDPSHTLSELPNIVLEAPDFELWINELWHDFLIEPTPYLVVSAMSYLGFILLVLRYYGAFWWLICLFFQFVPWDEDLGFG